jgi:hypothetical protein
MGQGEEAAELLRRAQRLQLLVLQATCVMSGPQHRLHGERMEWLAQWCATDLEAALAGPPERRADGVDDASLRALELRVTARVASLMSSCRLSDSLAIGACAEEVREQAVLLAEALRRSSPRALSRGAARD